LNNNNGNELTWKMSANQSDSVDCFTERPKCKKSLVSEF